MIISQPVTVETSIKYALKIMGMDLSTFLLVFLIVGLIAGFGFHSWWQTYKREKNIARAKNCVLLEIVPISGGHVKRELCEVYKGEAKQINDKSRGSFTLTTFIKAPKEHNIDSYYAFPEHDYLDVYPYDAPAKQQIPITKYYFTENDPFPKLPHDPSKWDTERVTQVTAAFAKLSREESVAQTILGQFSGFFEGLIASLPLLKRIPIIFILEIVILVGIVAIVYLLFTQGQTVANIAKFTVPAAPVK